MTLLTLAQEPEGDDTLPLPWAVAAEPISRLDNRGISTMSGWISRRLAAFRPYAQNVTMNRSPAIPTETLQPVDDPTPALGAESAAGLFESSPVATFAIDARYVVTRLNRAGARFAEGFFPGLGNAGPWLTCTAAPVYGVAVRPIAHHQTGGQGCPTGSVHVEWNRSKTPRADRCSDRGRKSLDIPGPLADQAAGRGWANVTRANLH